MLNPEIFRNKHLGQAAWIVGNGPSLNQMDLIPLRDSVTFCMNRIYLGVEKFGFTPMYYTVEDVFVGGDDFAPGLKLHWVVTVALVRFSVVQSARSSQ